MKVYRVILRLLQENYILWSENQQIIFKSTPESQIKHTEKKDVNSNYAGE